jgi:hypothetical protein
MLQKRPLAALALILRLCRQGWRWSSPRAGVLAQGLPTPQRAPAAASYGARDSSCASPSGHRDAAPPARRALAKPGNARA